MIEFGENGSAVFNDRELSALDVLRDRAKSHRKLHSYADILRDLKSIVGSALDRLERPAERMAGVDPAAPGSDRTAAVVLAVSPVGDAAEDAPGDPQANACDDLRAIIDAWNKETETIYTDANGLTVDHEYGDGDVFPALAPGRRYRVCRRPHGFPGVRTSRDTLDVLMFQRGPISSAGVNGVTNEALIAILIHRIGILDADLHCPENTEAMLHLRAAAAVFEQRTARRKAAGVEGTTTEALEPCPLPTAQEGEGRVDPFVHDLISPPDGLWNLRMVDDDLEWAMHPKYPNPLTYDEMRAAYEEVGPDPFVRAFSVRGSNGADLLVEVKGMTPDIAEGAYVMCRSGRCRDALLFVMEKCGVRLDTALYVVRRLKRTAEEVRAELMRPIETKDA